MYKKIFDGFDNIKAPDDLIEKSVAKAKRELNLSEEREMPQHNKSY